MKKIVRVVWISLLSGLAFLVACTSQGKLTKQERKALKAERDAIVASIDSINKVSNTNDLYEQLENKKWEMTQLQRLQDINGLLLDKEAVSDNQNSMEKLNKEIGVISKMIQESIPACVYGPPSDYEQKIINPEKERLQKELDQLRETIKELEGERVYGSPEIIKERQEEIEKLQRRASAIETEILNL